MTSFDLRCDAISTDSAKPQNEEDYSNKLTLIHKYYRKCRRNDDDATDYDTVRQITDQSTSHKSIVFPLAY